MPVIAKRSVAIHLFLKLSEAFGKSRFGTCLVWEALVQGSLKAIHFLFTGIPAVVDTRGTAFPHYIKFVFLAQL